MNRLLYIIICVVLLTGCSYDEEVELCRVSVQLVYPEGSVEPYAGAPVECRGSRAGVFMAETNAGGVATFMLTPGIYEFSTTSQFIDTSGETWWRYNFNGTRSQSKQKIPKKENRNIQIQRKNIQSQNQCKRCRKSNHQKISA